MIDIIGVTKGKGYEGVVIVRRSPVFLAKPTGLCVRLLVLGHGILLGFPLLLVGLVRMDTTAILKTTKRSTGLARSGRRYTVPAPSSRGRKGKVNNIEDQDIEIRRNETKEEEEGGDENTRY